MSNTLNDADKTREQLLSEIETLRGRVSELLGSLADQVQQREDLLREHELLEALMDSVPALIAFKDLEGRFVRVNQRQAEWLGLARSDQAIGQSDASFYAAADAARFRADERQVLRSGQALLDQEELLAPLRNGQPIAQRWFSTTKAPIIGADGEAAGIVSVSRDISLRRKAEDLARQNEMRDELVRMQQSMLDQLSTPVIPLSDDVLAMPLIGAIDSHRAERMLEALLDGVGQQRARVAILDITGVPVVDTQVANVLLQAARAVQLLGAQVVLTGIRPEVAQTLVGLGIDLRHVVTRSTLQSGIAYALGGR